MNDSTKIDLLGDTFEIFSLSSEEEIDGKFKEGGEEMRVFLLPSLTADFALRVYDKSQKEHREYHAAALIAAAFLIRKRGLPLSDIVFEAPCGKIKVFCTGEGVLRITIDKCKQLLSAQDERTGCDVKYNDLFVTKRIRALHAEDASLFRLSRLSEFAMLDTEFPSAVLLSSQEEGTLKMYSCRGYSEDFTSSLLLWCCAAFNERTVSRNSLSKFQIPEYSAALEASASSVTVEIEPIIL